MALHAQKVASTPQTWATLLNSPEDRLAGGAVESVRLTPLLPFEQGVSVLQRARAAEYVPPRPDMAYFGIEG